MSDAIIAHEFLSAFLFYTCFCRSVKMSADTVREIRLAFWALSISSVIAMFAPLRGWRPDYVTLALLAGICIVQYTTARYWIHGTPNNYQAHIHASIGIKVKA
jgi:hypothetical protein